MKKKKGRIGSSVKDFFEKDGVKYDAYKARLDLIPPEAINALGQVLTYGEQKYGSRNWELGMDWGRVFAAAQRHLWKWWSGTEQDDESKLDHLYHALANIAFLIAYHERKIGTDTRARVLGKPKQKTKNNKRVR